MQGFLNLNKSAGFTSHDCVARVRKLLRLKRVGHAGTLDPAATGVLPIALGRATRLLQYLRQDKAYRATIRLGMQTTTDDLEGETIATHPASELTRAVVEQALQGFQGVIQQVPPHYSAIQIDGKRLYDLARAGQTIEVPARQVEVFDLTILDWRSGDFPELEVAIACGPGTYIRSIARDLGQALGIGGTLARLIRTCSSGFDLAESLTLEDLEEQLQQGAFMPILPEQALAHLPRLNLNPEIAKRWCQGQRIAGLETEGGVTGMVQVYEEMHRFLGIGQLQNSGDQDLLVPQMVFEAVST